MRRLTRIISVVLVAASTSSLFAIGAGAAGTSDQSTSVLADETDQPCDESQTKSRRRADLNACDDELVVRISDLVSAASTRGAAGAGRPKDCQTYVAPPEGGAPPTERQPMPEADGLEEGKRYYTACYYTDTEPNELAWADFFIYEPGMEGQVIEAVAREIADEMPLTYPTPATAPAIDAEQLVGLPTWLWIAPTDWAPVEVGATLAGYQITVTATPLRVEWDLGEGDNDASDGTVTCDGPGTPWNPGVPDDAQSTDCSYTYQWTPAPPDTTYPASATIVWDVAYTATGQPGGSLGQNETTTNFELTVTERQAVVCYDTHAEDCHPA